MAQLGNTVVNGSLRVVGDFYANGYIDTTVTLTAAGWSGSGLYTQTITVAGVQADNNYRVYKYISSGATAADIKTYNKNFGYITAGYATPGTNQITFTTIKKPTANVTIRIVGDSNVERTTVQNTEVTSMKSDIANINTSINSLNTSLAGKFSGVDYLDSISVNTSIFKNWNGNANELSLYNFGGYKIVVVNLAFHTSSTLNGGTSYNPFTFPAVVCPSGNKLLSGAQQGNSCFAWLAASTGVITYKCMSNVGIDTECNVFGIYSINF